MKAHPGAGRWAASGSVVSLGVKKNASGVGVFLDLASAASHFSTETGLSFIVCSFYLSSPHAAPSLTP